MMSEKHLVYTSGSQKETTPENPETTKTSSVISDLEEVVDELLKDEIENIRRQAIFEPDKAVAARLMLKIMKPLAVFFLGEERLGTDPETVRNAVGQAMGNMMLIAVTRQELRGLRQAEGFKEMMDASIATIGISRTHRPSGLIVPG